jgi:NhaA family Na+:H+ antiporter
MSDFVDRTSRLVRGEGWQSAGDRYDTLRRVEVAARESISPVQRLEAALHPYVGFLIMPLFALANAGVEISIADFRDPVATAVMMGLVIGKPVGIVTTSYIAVRLGLATLPENINWGVMVAAGFLAGIGFTMALFIAGLALDETHLDPAKIGILAGSALSGVIGVAMLVWLLPKKASAALK